MLGKIIQAVSKNTGTSTVGVEVAGQTVISMDNISDFATDTGFIETVGTVYPYSSVDRVNSTLTLTTPLVMDLPQGTPVRQFPYSIQKWALVRSSEGDSVLDVVWALIPHAL